MLVYLKVENLAVVEKVVLRFGEGFNVLTGETGAGKSILIDALNLLQNKRLPREGQRNPQRPIVVEALFAEGDEETVLKREISAGRSLCFVNDDAVPFSRLQSDALAWLNIYGQRDHLFLLEQGNHLGYLDDFCGQDLPLSELKSAHQALRQSMADLQQVKNEKHGADTQKELLEFQIRELEQFGLRRGEEEELEAKVKIMASAEEIACKSSSLLVDLYDGECSVYSLLARSEQARNALRVLFPAEEALFVDMDHFFQTLPEMASFLRRIGDTVEYDESEFNLMQERLVKLGQLKKRYGATLDGLLDRLEQMRSEKEHLDNIEFSLLEAERSLQKKLEIYTAIHQRCRTIREAGARRLEKLVVEELKSLAMPKGEFAVRFRYQEPTPETVSAAGCDEIEFYFSSNPGQAPGPIREIASGGELSRLMLILKALAPSDGRACYIFDEIDTGVGGKTAEFVGARLKEIARKHQVLCISHLPQIAACATSHFLVEKRFEAGQTFSSVRLLEGDERVEEIGRLMAGSSSGRSVMQAAQELLQRHNSSQD